MTNFVHPAADLIPAAALETLEDAISLHSDVYKDYTGIRPRLDVVWDVVAQDPQGFTNWLHEEVEKMGRQERERQERKALERVEFRAKLEALGVNPEKYMSLA